MIVAGHGAGQEIIRQGYQTIYHEYHPDMYFVEPLYSKRTKISKIMKTKPIKKVKKKRSDDGLLVMGIMILVLL